ncbi:MAG TPA: arylamine N-acetyltransferase [Candidatus Nanopelagicales bacterium]|nr:arylamine N-acetyltransferase [Candidatus Nanopelagicales bacterium]
MERSELTGAYLDVLGVAAGSPTPELVAEIQRRHVATFAFSSVGPRLGEPLPLDPVEIYDRIVVRRRGGYCFEHNGLMFEVLCDLGYEPRLILGRVLLSGNPHPGLTHRISVVELGGVPHVVDVGFGAPGPHLPVPLGGDEVGSSWRRFRVVELRPGHWYLQSRTGDDWLSLYRFELLEYGPMDCEVGHFYSHRSPNASFVNRLVASRILDGEVRSLQDRDYWVIGPEGSDRRTIDDAELHALLADQLDVRVTEDEAARLLPPRP